MIFSILVLGSPASSQSARTALRFSRAALAGGHSISRVFFFDDGAHIGNALATPPQDEVHWGEQWQQLGADHDIELILCVSSALKRGVLDTTEANRYEREAANLLPHYEISGLGQLVDATLNSDRVVTFGA